MIVPPYILERLSGHLRFPDPILAVDPGPTRSGWVWVQANAVVQSGTLPNDHILDLLADALPTIAIERFEARGMSIGDDSIETIIWTGRMIQAAHTPDAVIRVRRRDVKHFLCGNVTAKDTNIRQALIDLLGPPGTKKSKGPTYGVHGDAWAALGVAVTAQGHGTGSGRRRDADCWPGEVPTSHEPPCRVPDTAPPPKTRQIAPQHDRSPA